MAPFTSLQIRIWQDWATGVSALTPASGAWTAGTYHFLVRAQYKASSSDADTAGIGVFGVTSDSVVEAVVVAANDDVNLTWSAARTQPEKYEIYYQDAAVTGDAVNWDYDLAATKTAEVDGDTLTVSINAAANLGSLPTSHNSLTTITLEAIQDIMPQGRQMYVPGVNGIYVPQSYGFTTCELPNGLTTELASFETITLPMRMISCTHANRQTLHKWATNSNTGPRMGWPIILIDSNTSSHCVYDYYHGNILNISNLHSNDKMGTSGEYMITFGIQGVHRA